MIVRRNDLIPRISVEAVATSRKTNNNGTRMTETSFLHMFLGAFGPLCFLFWTLELPEAEIVWFN